MSKRSEPCPVSIADHDPRMFFTGKGNGNDSFLSSEKHDFGHNSLLYSEKDGQSALSMKIDDLSKPDDEDKTFNFDFV